jgi:hypothetical protein
MELLYKYQWSCVEPNETNIHSTAKSISAPEVHQEIDKGRLDQVDAKFRLLCYLKPEN